MGDKRPREDTAQERGQSSHGQHKRSRFNAQGEKPRPKHHPAPAPNPLNPLKARMRSLRRLLAHDDDADARASRASAHMHPERNAAILHGADELEIADKHNRRDERRVKRLPAGVRVEHERELKGLKDEIAALTTKKRKADLISRWHKVRFFERKKAERRIKKLEKAGEDSHAAKVDLNYALYFPLERDYVSLWPRKKDGEEEDPEEGRKGDRDMWLLVERCMANSTLEDLKEGRVEGCGVSRPEKTETRPTAASKPKAEKPIVHDDNDSDDGGFFEE